jgi:hypothetical protein
VGLFASYTGDVRRLHLGVNDLKIIMALQKYWFAPPICVGKDCVLAAILNLMMTS